MRVERMEWDRIGQDRTLCGKDGQEDGLQSHSLSLISGLV